jgi:hypothetical protein
MPQQQIIPIWGGLNNANSPSATGLLDPVTGQQYNTGGLNVGDYFDLTEKEANQLSVSTIGLCHAGRYRYVQVDSGATAANVKTGTVGYLRAGSFVQAVQTITVGSGQTAGTYTIAATVGSGGGAGAVIQVVVGSAGTISGNPVVLNGGYGYVGVPTFSLTALGGTPGTLAVQLNSTPNIVTSADQVGAAIPTAIPVRPVVFLNAPTPGNFTFIQELGLATVLAKSAVGTASLPAYVNAVTTDPGTVTTTGPGSPIISTIGLAVDIPANGILFKALLGYACMVIQD